MYSLGIVLFELFSSFTTNMERSYEISKLRNAAAAGDSNLVPSGKRVITKERVILVVLWNVKSIKSSNFLKKICILVMKAEVQWTEIKYKFRLFSRSFQKVPGDQLHHSPFDFSWFVRPSERVRPFELDLPAARGHLKVRNPGPTGRRERISSRKS